MAIKKPSIKETPPSGKTPRGADKAAIVKGQRIAWHLRIMDRSGPWGWGFVNINDFWNEIFQKMSHFETNTWCEVLNRNSHAVKIEKLSKEAQRRLIEIGQDDIEEIVSLRITGEKRLWGIRDQNILKILWWDPKHTVCKSNLKHT